MIAGLMLSDAPWSVQHKAHHLSWLLGLAIHYQLCSSKRITATSRGLPNNSFLLTATRKLYQEETLAKIHQELLDSQRRRREEREAETVQADWCYGPQKLNYVELKKVRK